MKKKTFKKTNTKTKKKTTLKAKAKKAGRKVKEETKSRGKIKWSKSGGDYSSQEFPLGGKWKFQLTATKVKAGKYILIAGARNGQDYLDPDYAYFKTGGYPIKKVKEDAQKMLDAGVYTRVSKPKKGHAPYKFLPDDFFDEKDRFSESSPVENPAKKTKKKITLKAKAKKAGRKVKKVAKTDMGRAGIGGGIGALALGPIGAVIGAGYAISSSKKKKSKKNPGDVDRYTSTDLLIPFKMYLDNKDLTKKRRAYWKKWGVLDRIDELTARGIPVNISSKEIGVIDGTREDEYPGTYNVRISKGGGGYYKKGDTAFAVRADKIVANNMEYFHGIPDPAFIRGSRIALGDKYRPHGGNVELPNARHNPPKRAKKNPGPTCKLSTTMGNLLLDYHKAGEAVEHVAASALRGERVELRYVKAARADLKKIQGIQPNESEKEQIGELVDALGRVIAKCEGAATPRSKPAPKSNPARAFSLETEVNRSRQKKAKGAAGKHSRASSAASDAARQSLRKRMAALNPGSYRSQVVDFSDAKLDAEHKAASSLITRAKRHPDTSQKMVDDLVKVRGYITDEKKARKKRKSGRRGSSGHSVPVANPTTVGRSKGKFAKFFTPDKEELRLLRKYKMMDKLKDVSASQIERIVTRLKRQEKEELKVEYPTVMDLAETYARARSRYQILVTSPGTGPGDIARAKKKFDEAEDALALYAEIRNMEPALLKEIVWHTKKKEREAKSRAKGAKPNPDHGPVKHIVAGGLQTSRRGFKPFFHPKDADPESILKASLFYVANKGKVSLVKLERKFGYKFVWRVLLNEKYLRFDGAPAMSIEEIEKHFKIYPDNGLLVITPKGKKIADRARAELSSLSREEQEWEEHVQRPRDNPLSHVTERTPYKKFRAAISRNIAAEMKAGRPQKQAIAIALNQARSDAPKKATKIYGPKPNPEKADKGVTVIPMQLPAEAVNRMIKEAGRAIKAGKSDKEYGYWEKSLKEWGIPKKIAIDVADGKARIVGNLQDGYYHEYINLKWKARKNNPSVDQSVSGPHMGHPDHLGQINHIVRILSDGLERYVGASARKEFIRKARTYKRQPGFDGESAFTSFMSYILVESKYSALRSAKKSNYPKKKDVEKVIIKVARLISQNAIREKVRVTGNHAYSVAGKAYTYSAHGSGIAATSAAKAASAYSSGYGEDVAEAVESAVAAAIEAYLATLSNITDASVKKAYRQVGAKAYIDYAASFLKIMRKDTGRPRSKAKGNPAASKSSSKIKPDLYTKTFKKFIKSLSGAGISTTVLGADKETAGFDVRTGKSIPDIIIFADASLYAGREVKNSIDFDEKILANSMDRVPEFESLWRVARSEGQGNSYSFIVSPRKKPKLFVANPSSRFSRRKTKKNPEPTLVTKGKIGIAKFKGQGKGLTKKDLAQLEQIKGNLEIHYELASLYTGARSKTEKARITVALRDVNELIRTARRRANPKKKNPSELEGPLSFASGRVVYYDPGEGKYYDKGTDLYLSESEVELMQIGPKGRAKANPKGNPDFAGWEDVSSDPGSAQCFRKTIDGMTWHAEMDQHAEWAPYFHDVRAISGGGSWQTSFQYKDGDYDEGRLLKGVEKRIRKLMGDVAAERGKRKFNPKKKAAKKNPKKANPLENPGDRSPVQKAVDSHPELLRLVRDFSRFREERVQLQMDMDRDQRERVRPDGTYPDLDQDMMSKERAAMNSEIITENKAFDRASEWGVSQKELSHYFYTVRGRIDWNVRHGFKTTNPSGRKKAKKNPSRQAGGFYIVDTRVGKVVAGPYSVREADMTLEESGGYNHATHQVMDERHLTDLAFDAKSNPTKSQKKNPLGRGSGNSGPSADLRDYRISAHNMSDRVISTTFNKLKSSRDPVDRQKANILGTEMGVRDSVSRRMNPGGEESLKAFIKSERARAKSASKFGRQDPRVLNAVLRDTAQREKALIATLEEVKRSGRGGIKGVDLAEKVHAKSGADSGQVSWSARKLRDFGIIKYSGGWKLIETNPMGRRKNGSGAPLDWEKAQGESRVRKDRDTRIQQRLYGTFDGDSVVDLAKWTHSKRAKKLGIRTSKDRLKVINRESRQGNLRATPADCRKAKEIAQKDSFEEKPKIGGPSFRGDLEGFIEKERIYINKRISKARLETEKETLRRSFKVRKKALLVTQRELLRAGDLGIKKNDLKRKVTTESGATTDSPASWSINRLQALGLARYSDKKWRAVSPNPSSKRSTKKVTKKAVHEALSKSSVPWKWEQQKPGLILASKGKRTVEIRKWFLGPLDKGWVVSVFEGGGLADGYWVAPSIMDAIKKGDETFNKGAKALTKKKPAPKKVTKKAASGWKKVPHPEFPRYTWSPSDTVTYTVKRMYGSMFADQHEYVYSVTRKGPRSTTDIHQPGIDPKHINKLSDAKAFAEKHFKKKATNKKPASKTKPGWKILTDRCDKLWDDYDKKSTKKNLNLVFDHLAKMKASTKYETSKNVRDKRASCLRKANKEAKRLKIKNPGDVIDLGKRRREKERAAKTRTIPMISDGTPNIPKYEYVARRTFYETSTALESDIEPTKAQLKKLLYNVHILKEDDHVVPSNRMPFRVMGIDFINVKGGRLHLEDEIQRRMD